MLLLIAGVFPGSFGQALNTLVIVEICLILVQIIVLGTSLAMAYYGDSSAAAAVHQLIRSWLFLIVVLIVGLAVPILLLGYQRVVGSACSLCIIASILILLGGLFLRYCIIRAGLRSPIYPP